MEMRLFYCVRGDMAKRPAASTAKAAAEIERTKAEAQLARAEAAIKELELASKQRNEAETLAQDKYNHTYFFAGAVDSGSVKSCIDQLTQWMRRDPKCDITIVFKSPGGSVIDGMALWDFIQLLRSQGHHITTMTIGLAASMASILLQAGDTRVWAVRVG